MSKCPVCWFIKDAPRPETGGDALLPCPFCGSPAERIDIGNEAENRGGSVISCTKCLASTKVFFGEKVGLVEAWNRRALLASQGQGEVLAKWCRNLIWMWDIGGCGPLHSNSYPATELRKLLASQGQGDAGVIAILEEAKRRALGVHGHSAIDKINEAIAMLAHPQPAPGLREALSKAVPWVAEYLRHLRAKNDPKALRLTNDLADLRAALAQSSEDRP